MIDIIALASAVTGWLTPILPYLASSAEDAAKTLGEKVGEGVVEKAQDLYNLLWPSIRAKSAAHEAVIDASQAPQDTIVQGALEMQLRKILTDNPDLARRVQSFVDANSVAGNTIVASGQRSVASGAVSHGVVITGDKNKVS